MKLWTVQSAAAWEGLQRDGVLRTDATISLAGETDFVLEGAYRFMSLAMSAYIGAPPYAIANGSLPFPIWAFYTFQGRHHAPDLRYLRRHFAAPGERVVRLTIEIPDREVVLSSWSMWSYFLHLYGEGFSQEYEAVMRAYITRPERTPGGKIFTNLPPYDDTDAAGRIAHRLADWEMVFDLVEERMHVTETPKEISVEYAYLPSTCLQACFWELPLSAVTRAVFLTGNGDTYDADSI